MNSGWYVITGIKKHLPISKTVSETTWEVLADCWRSPTRCRNSFTEVWTTVTCLTGGHRSGQLDWDPQLPQVLSLIHTLNLRQSGRKAGKCCSLSNEFLLLSLALTRCNDLFLHHLLPDPSMACVCLSRLLGESLNLGFRSMHSCFREVCSSCVNSLSFLTASLHEMKFRPSSISVFLFGSGCRRLFGPCCYYWWATNGPLWIGGCLLKTNRQL